MSENRLRIARERAGLTVRQAARMLELDDVDLVHLEKASVDVVRAFVTSAITLVDFDDFVTVYGVRVEWLLGEVERYDYESVKNINGADRLEASDRDTIAEFAASMPRDNRTPLQRLEELRAKRRGSR